jgi:hypothetical protein
VREFKSKLRWARWGPLFRKTTPKFMKKLTVLLTSLCLLAQVPAFAKEEEGKKPSRKEQKEMEKKEDEKKDKKDQQEKQRLNVEKTKAFYKATVSTTAAPTADDASELKGLLNTGNDFVCDAAAVENGKIVANLHNDVKTGKLAKAAVAKIAKSNAKFKVDKVEEDKEANEKAKKEIEEKEKAMEVKEEKKDKKEKTDKKEN